MFNKVANKKSILREIKDEYLDYQFCVDNDIIEDGILDEDREACYVDKNGYYYARKRFLVDDRYYITRLVYVHNPTDEQVEKIKRKKENWRIFSEFREYQDKLYLYGQNEYYYDIKINENILNYKFVSKFIKLRDKYPKHFDNWRWHRPAIIRMKEVLITHHQKMAFNKSTMFSKDIHDIILEFI